MGKPRGGRRQAERRGGIAKLFGRADGYYWHHTLRHIRAKEECWRDEAVVRAGVQQQENASAAEDEVKPPGDDGYARRAEMVRLFAVKS